MFNYMIGMGLLKLVFGDRVASPDFQRRLGLISFVLITLAIACLGWFRGQRLEADLAALTTGGGYADGIVANKVESFYNNRTIYDLDVNYTAADQTRHSRKFQVEAPLYNSHSTGGAIQIHYVKSRPDTFYLVGDEPRPAEARLMHYFMIGGIGLSAISLAVLAMMWGGGEKTPNIRIPPPGATPKPSEPARPTRSLGTDGRPVFGKRA